MTHYPSAVPLVTQYPTQHLHYAFAQPLIPMTSELPAINTNSSGGTCSHSPSWTSHRAVVASKLAVARCRPQGDQQQERIVLVWASSSTAVQAHSPDGVFIHILTVLSPPQLANIFPKAHGGVRGHGHSQTRFQFGVSQGTQLDCIRRLQAAMW